MLKKVQVKRQLKNKMTEKQYAPTKTEKKTKIDGTSKKQKIDVAKTKEKKMEAKPVENQKSEEKPNVKSDAEKKVEEKKSEIKKPVKKNKKDEVVVNGKSVPISMKYSMAICKFIKHKSIQKAIADLEEVTKLRKAVPMKGEIPHRKGKIMSGRFPKRAAESFIMLLKSLLGNANNHDLDDPVISEAIANQASRPYGRRGIKRKRTHVTIRARNKPSKKNKKSTKKVKTPRAYPEKSSTTPKGVPREKKNFSTKGKIFTEGKK